MPAYQNSSVTQSKLIIGNYKIETAAYGTTAAGSWTNLGAGTLTSFKHTPSFFDTQAGNAPDPIEGVADEIATFDFELIEYDATAFASAFGGLLTGSATTTQSVLGSGGNSTITDRAFRFTNTSIIGGATKTTVINVFKAHMSSGLEFTVKSDNDTDPVQIMPMQVTAKIDGTLTAGSQLFTITKTL